MTTTDRSAGPQVPLVQAADGRVIDDQDVRDRAAQQLDTSIVLSAPAGSGKTRVLTERLLQLLICGTPPSRIAAITFTRRAAGELQLRIRDALEARLAAGSDPALAKILAQLHELTLSTIHSFCSRLLAIEGLAAGWSPDTQIRPGPAADQIDQTLAAWQRDFRRRHTVAALILQQRVRPAALRRAARALLAWRDLRPMSDPEPFVPDGAVEELREIWARLEEAASTCTEPDTDKLLENNAALRALLQGAVICDADAAVARVLTSREQGRKLGGRRDAWGAGGKEAFIEALDAFRSWRQRHLARLHGLVVRDLHARWMPLVSAARAASSVADHDDLLFAAATVLTDGAARGRLASRYDAILVDEVQDTDPIQAEIAALLARDPVATGPWNAHPPRPGHLFVVGDPHQSIYRFRRADLHTWSELEELVARSGAALSLVQNFRAVPGLTAWLNSTFAQLPGYVPQRPHRHAAALPPVVRLVTPPGLEAELDGVVRHLLELARSGQVADPTTGALRPVRWSDIMLLLPAWTQADALGAALLRARIPYLTQGGNTFLKRDEVRLCRAALAALEEPTDERSLVFVLRGLFGLDWEMLAHHRAVGGTWRYTDPAPPPGPVADAFALLRSLATHRGQRSWVALLDELLERTQITSTWALLRDGPARLANLDKLRALLQEGEALTTSPGQALQHLDTLEAQQDLPRTDPDHDAVQITSYFKAKGLEAPIVVLCCARRGGEPVQAVVDRRGRRVALRIGDLVPLDWDEHLEQERLANEAERRRWMYVATTRARDQLVLVDHKDNTLIQNHLGPGLLQATTVLASELPAPPLHTETFPDLDDTVDGWLTSPPPGGPDPTEAFRASRASAIEASRAHSARWLRSPTPGPIATVIGRVLAQLDLTARPELLEAELDVLVADAVEPSQAGLVDRCTQAIRALLRHPVLGKAQSAPERWVLTPFSLPDGDTFVSGCLDLVFPTDTSRRDWVVVDFSHTIPVAHLERYGLALLSSVSDCVRVEVVSVSLP
ncbi:MAG TPA: hypothetical protein ENK18_08915 [Deltaproteobacteria bacterium]|nr:hypothetical protein [Deltaproteobacteria bacterium]